MKSMGHWVPREEHENREHSLLPVDGKTMELTIVIDQVVNLGCNGPLFRVLKEKMDQLACVNMQ